MLLSDVVGWAYDLRILQFYLISERAERTGPDYCEAPKSLLDRPVGQHQYGQDFLVRKQE